MTAPPVHFVPWGSEVASCGWNLLPGDRDLQLVTDRRRDTTCPDCLAHFSTSAFLERACEVMHNAYEAAAPGAGWQTQQASRKPWAEVPEANKATMRAALTALLAWLPSQDQDPR